MLLDDLSPHEIAIGLIAVHQQADVAMLDHMLIENGINLKGDESTKELLGHCRRQYAYLRGLGWTLAKSEGLE